MKIQINRVYARNNPNSPDRTVRGVYGGGTVLYSVPNGEHAWQVAYKTCSYRAMVRWADSEVGEGTNVERWAFLDSCRRLVATRGVPLSRDSSVLVFLAKPYGSSSSSCLSYQDDRVVVVVDKTSGRMNIVRLAVDDHDRPHLRHQNPVIHTDSIGKPYRYHGEYKYLVDHVRGLISET